MQQSSFIRNRSLNDVSQNVLRLINNKICPLNQEKMNKIIKNRKKQKLTRVGTDPTEFLSPLFSSKQTPKNKSSFHEFQERTIGEHFNQFQTRELMSSKIQNKDYGLMTEKINGFIWSRRQEIISNLIRKKDAKRVELSKEAINQKNNHLRKSSANLSHFIGRLRKKLKDEYQRESEAYETPILRYSQVALHKKVSCGMNFFEENCGLEKVMERYPLEESQVMALEDSKKKYQRGLLQDINEQQSNDKYTRMRININHRKIISLK